MIFKRKDFLSLQDLNSDEITYLLSTSETMKYVLNQKNKKSPYLHGKNVLLMFYSHSSKARLSYELAATSMSASVVDMVVSDEVRKSETLKDAGILADQMGADFIVFRHPMSGAAHFLSKNTNASIINAGDGNNENPGQALFDLLTIKEHKKDFKGLNVTIVGDVRHSKAGKSLIWGLRKLECNVRIAAPPTFIPERIDEMGVNVFYDLNEALVDSDVVMLLRMSDEIRNKNIIPSTDEYRNRFKVTSRNLKLAKENAILLHPGPINRGVDIASELINSRQFILNDKMANSVATRMAIFYLLSNTGGDNNGDINKKL